MWRYIKNVRSAVVVGLTSSSIGIWDYIHRRNGALDIQRVESQRIQELEAENRAQRQQNSDIIAEAKHNWTEYSKNDQEIDRHAKAIDEANKKGWNATAEWHQKQADDLVKEQNKISDEMKHFNAKHNGPDADSYISDNENTSWDSFNNYLDSMRDFNSSLDDNQLLAFIHCSIIVVIYIALYSVFIYKIWDYVIIRYDLEKKYPRISLIFRVRNKLSKYSQIFYLILIVILLLILFSLNFAILFKLI